MKNLSILIKPASSLCNMRCRYCFYADVAENRGIPSYGIMSPETARALLTSVSQDLSPGDRLTLAFQGGEPTLAGLSFFRSFFDAVDELLPEISVSYAFQTNGLLLDEEWCAFFREHDVLVGLSVDGSAEMHNACRLDAAGKGTYSRIHRSMKLLAQYGVRFNILTVLTSGMARHPSAVWNWLVKEGVEFVQFIPCLDMLDASEPSPCALTPERFRDFYRQLFPLWKKHLESGHFLSVKLFDDLINLYLAHQATACGISGQCSVQYIVEANGDVFPCDFYVLDQYRMGSLLENRPSELLTAGKSFLPEGREYAEQEPCRSCRFSTACGGGCKRLKNSMAIDRQGNCRYAELLEELLPPLLSFAQKHLT